jgi:hypothetical protein
MNIKRILLISLIFLMAVSSLSMVSAGWFDFGNSQNNIINISDFKFNIPDGYDLDNESADMEEDVGWYVKDAKTGVIEAGTGMQLAVSGGMKAEIVNNDYSKVPDGVKIYNESYKKYVNHDDANKSVSIYIQHPFNGTAKTDDKLELNKTINDIKGQFEQEEKYCKFTYVKDGSLIEIEAPDEGLISNVIVNK